MNYYQLRLKSAAAEEGDGFRYKKRAMCATCGLRPLVYAAEFPVPEDSVDTLSVALWDKPLFPVSEAAGLLISESMVAEAMLSAGLTGIEIRDAAVAEELLTGERVSLPKYSWLAITGRCHTNDIWTRVVSVCPTCATPKTESLPRTTRDVMLLQPPKEDFCRAREAVAGIIVSERFVDFATKRLPEVASHLQLKTLNIG